MRVCFYIVFFNVLEITFYALALKSTRHIVFMFAVGENIKCHKRSKEGNKFYIIASCNPIHLSILFPAFPTNGHFYVLLYSV